jgi:L-threonylcarbamoyladenylate synthase
VFSIDPNQPDARLIEEAATALGRGELVVLPTETVYGLGAHPEVGGAAQKVYGAKGRAPDKPLTLLAADVQHVKKCGAVLGPVAVALARQFWPGPLTLVLKTPNGFTGFRVPKHPVSMALLRRVGGLLAVTSANRSGAAPALTAREAADTLEDRVAVILDAGPSPGGIPSTVVRVDGEKVEILRNGAISDEAIRKAAEGKL